MHRPWVMLLSAASSCLFWLLSVRLMSKPDIPPTRHMPNNVPATTDKATESDVSDVRTRIDGFHRRQRDDKAERTGE